MHGPLSLRPATLDDAALLLAWRNDPATRDASHSTAEISLVAHLEWLGRVLADPARALWIAEIAGSPVGSVRADKTAGITTLSWMVAPSARGQGVGTRMLAEAMTRVSGPVRAEVKQGNTASARMAEAAGLALLKQVGGVMYYGRG